MRFLVACLARLFFYALVGVFILSLAGMAWSYHRSEWVYRQWWGAVMRDEQVAMGGTKWTAGLGKGGLQFHYYSYESLVPPERARVSRWGMHVEWEHSWGAEPHYPLTALAETRGPWWINYWWLPSQGWIQTPQSVQRGSRYGVTVPLALPTLISGGLAFHIWRRRRRRAHLRGFPVNPVTPIDERAQLSTDSPDPALTPPRGGP
jgi:hypothetical protein